MQKKSIVEIKEKYDLELDRIVKTIKKEKAKKVLLQFPDGMKPYSLTVSEEIEKKTGCVCFIFLGTCFGACDVPIEVQDQGIDLVVQFGHSSWDYKNIKNLKVLR